MDAPDSEATVPMQAVAVPIPNEPTAATLRQPTVEDLVKSALREISTEKKRFIIESACIIIVAAAVGCIFYGSGHGLQNVFITITITFFMLVSAALTGLFPTVVTLPHQLKKFVDDDHIMKSTMCYYFARVLVDMTFLVLASTVFTSIIYVLTSLPFDSDRMYSFIFFVTLTALIAYSLALLIATTLTFQSNRARAWTALGIVTPMFVLCGFWFPADYTPSLLFSSSVLNFGKQAFKGAMVTIYGGDREPCHREYENCRFVNASDVLDVYSIASYGSTANKIALVAIFLGYQAITVALLYWRHLELDKLQKHLRNRRDTT